MSKKIFMIVFAMSFLTALTRVEAGTWTATGILVTQNKEAGHFNAQYVEIKDFDSYEKCFDTIKMLAHSDEFIGKGGTNHKVPRVDWNYDADCIHVNDK